MRCSQCQHENRESAKFCESCGSPLAVTCPSCDNVARHGASFCDNCGTPLTEQQAPTSPQSQEESVRTLVETRVLMGDSGAYQLVQDLPTIQVPATVQAILAARIDRLAQDEKQLLQTASVIGTEVPFTLLQAIAEMSEEALYSGLTHLQTAEFLYETSLYPERVYTFKHALTHEVAYGSLLQERRRVLHARTVEALEAVGSDRIDDQVERLAQHAFRGEMWDKAFIYFRQSGQKALGSSANLEAASYFEQALDVLQYLPESSNVIEQGIDVRFDLRNALLALGAFSRLLDYLRDAERLAESLKDQRRQGRASSYIGNYFLRTGDYNRALTYGQQALTLAIACKKERGSEAWTLRLLGDELGMRPLQAHCHRGLGKLYSQTSQPEQARAELSTAIGMYRNMEMTFWLPETEAALSEVEGDA